MSDGSPSKHFLSSKLTKTDSEIIDAFSSLQSTEDVAKLLEIRNTQLTYILWRLPADQRYNTWQIRKRNGKLRNIDAPNQTIKILQQKLLTVLTLVFQPRSSSHGFIQNKNIITNATVHTRRRWVLNIDLENFFPTIHFGRVRGMLMANPYNIGERAATTISQLCCHNKTLPQGAPTSPIISNMICSRLDAELRRFAKLHNCKYTRYADDITFSTNAIQFPKDLIQFNKEISEYELGLPFREIIVKNGFVPNDQKTRLQHRSTRQEVTGLTANRRPNVRRAYTSQIRAMLHAWAKYGYEAAQGEFLSKYDTKHRPCGVSDRVFEKVIWGKLAFLRQVRGSENSEYLSLKHQYNALTGKTETIAFRKNTMQYDVFICHASEDKSKVVEPLSKALQDANIRVWIDEDVIGWGDSVTREINDGLARSKFVILVLSKSFLVKKWPVKEMNAILNKEIISGTTCALPLIVGNKKTKESILAAYPLLIDKHYKEWSPADVGSIVSAIKARLTASQ